jgi:hypothetical protein
MENRVAFIFSSSRLAGNTILIQTGFRLLYFFGPLGDLKRAFVQRFLGATTVKRRRCSFDPFFAHDIGFRIRHLFSR